MKHVEIYTDGACRGNPGVGGWGAILVYQTAEKELSGGEAQTTNNRMELTAAICALRALKEPCDVTLTSDSKYLIDAMEQGWAEEWKKKGWRKADRSEALNSDLWEELLTLTKTHTVHYVWVHGTQDIRITSGATVLQRLLPIVSKELRNKKEKL